MEPRKTVDGAESGSSRNNRYRGSDQHIFLIETSRSTFQNLPVCIVAVSSRAAPFGRNHDEIVLIVRTGPFDLRRTASDRLRRQWKVAGVGTSGWSGGVGAAINAEED